MLGYSALAVKEGKLHEIHGFANFAHYCTERLGLAPRTVQQRMAVEQRLWQLPALREAQVLRHLSYEQVRILTRLPDAKVAEWIPRAQGMTCIQLRRAIQAEEDAQMRAAKILVADVPVTIARLLTSAFKAVRAAENPRWSDGKCLVAIASHFVSVWKPLVKKARTRSQKVRERDLGLCTVPMCSRVAAHSHHVEFRGRGGSNEEENQTGICAGHHLRGVHGGYLKVTGTAPNGLVWELGGEICGAGVGAGVRPFHMTHPAEELAKDRTRARGSLHRESPQGVRMSDEQATKAPRGLLRHWIQVLRE